MKGAALLLAVTLLAASPQGGTLPQGGTYAFYTDTTLQSAAIDLWFRAPGAGYDNASPGIARLAATAAAAATLESGRSLVSLVRGLGGRFSISVYPDITGVTAIVPAADARKVVAAMTAAYFTPRIDEKALTAAQADGVVLALQQRYLSEDVLHNLLFAQLFASGPAHYAPLPDSVDGLRGISLDAVKAFAARAFRPANATLTAAGGIDTAALGSVAAGGVRGTMDGPIDSSINAQPEASSTASGAVSGVGLAWVGPAIRNERDATAMDFVADYLFRDETGTFTKSLDPASDVRVSGQFITLHDPGVMLITISGAKAGALQDDVLKSIQALASPMNGAAFSAAREAFLYHLASDTQTPAAQADNLGWYTAEGDPGYAPSDVSSRYWNVARSLSPNDVANAVKRYLSHPVVVHLIPQSKEKAS